MENEDTKNQSNILFGYFLPTDADIDETSVHAAMMSNRKDAAFFLDLGTGDVTMLKMPRDHDLYESMKREIFAYAEIPRVVVEGGPTNGEVLQAAFQFFIDSLPVTVERDLAELCGEDCDCIFCELKNGRNEK